MYRITNEKRKEILKFYLKYRELFSKDVHYLFTEFYLENEFLCDTLLEFYTYLHAIEDYVNPYYDFYKYLCEKHANISKKKILEIASGYIPAFSYLLVINQKMENIIVAMDPVSLPLKIKGVTIKNNLFSLETDLQNIDLLIAHCPCEALETILNKAVNEKKEFTIQTCKCTSGSSFNFYSRKDWHYYISSLIDKAKSLENSGFIVEKEYLNLSRMTDSPIITARKR